MKDVLISVVVPVYNVPLAAVERCIKSVYAQTHENWQLIVVDDGSEPAYSERYAEMCKADARIRYMYKENGGASSARNLGTQLAQGQYIAYMDADDYVLPHYLGQALAQLESHSLDFILGGACHEGDQGGVELSNRVEVFEGDKSPIVEHFQETIGSRFPPIPPRWALGSGPVARLLKANLAKSTPFREDIPLNEDTLWNMEVLCKCARVGVSYDTWYVIVPTEGSVTRRYRPSCIAESEKQLAYVRDYIEQHYPSAVERYFSRVLQDFGRVMHLQLMHPQSELTAREQHTMIVNMLKREPWREAFAKVNPQFLNRNRKILTWLVRHKMYRSVWLISRMRVKQLEGKNI